MGSDKKKDSQVDDDETPQHEVELGEFYLARYPVTVAQFKAFVEASSYEPDDPDSLNGFPNHPVVNVTWYDAIAYCDWLTTQLLYLHDLPSDPPLDLFFYPLQIVDFTVEFALRQEFRVSS